MSDHLLNIIQEKFKKRDDIVIVSHTVDPKRDSVETLYNYSKEVHAKEGMWYFLTGEKEDIYNLAFDGYFASVQRDEAAPGGFLHSELIFLVDKNGRLRGTFDSEDNIVPAFVGTSVSDMKKMVDAIDNLLREEFIPRKTSQ
jgi:protein SCO1/2